MSQMERVFSIDRLLRRKVPPGREELLRRMEVSPATLKRDLDFMRDRLHAPIVWDRERHGYRYAAPGEGQPEFELPGLWFSPGEIHALLLMREIVSQLQPGFLAESLKPFERRLEELAEEGRSDGERIALRVTPARTVNPELFQGVATATLKRRRLKIRYFGRHRNAESERIVSPQRLLYYRGAWYLDAWCHTKNALRRFALDALRGAQLLLVPAIEADPNRQAEGYGIYAGKEPRVAALRFDCEAARWVADEEWHLQQDRTWLPNGSLVLRVPFGHPQELVMDILRHGSHVEVLEPEDLRQEVITTLNRASALYERPSRRRPQSTARQESRRAHAG